MMIQHTNQLVKCASAVAERNNIKLVPFPEKHFKNKQYLESYLSNLTNFIKHPELFYLQKNKIPVTDFQNKMSMFLALSNVDKTNGAMTYYSGTHKFGYLGDAGIINENLLDKDWPKFSVNLKSIKYRK